MTGWKLIRRSLRFYWRTHLGVLAGAAIASAVLVGALVVGDSVRHSLREIARARLGRVELALFSRDRFFRAELAGEVAASLGADSAPALLLRAAAASSDGSARVNRVQVIGVDERFWRLGSARALLAGDAGDRVVLNDRLARHLGVSAGDDVLLRVDSPSSLPRDAPLSGEADASVAIRATVRAVASEADFGHFSLQANQVPPFNAFVPLATLQKAVELSGRANLILTGPAKDPDPTRADAVLRERWQLADADLDLRELPGRSAIELRTGRVFLDPPAADAAMTERGAAGVLTYFVNEIRLGDKATPYSMVSALSPAVGGIVPPEMGDDEILINQWLAEDLGARVGDALKLNYYVLGPMRALDVSEGRFRVRGVVPLAGAAADRTLMPEFPGLADVDNCRDWQPGIPIDLDKIRKKDELYWKAHRGTPKAFVTLRAGQEMWRNRFGSLTAVRFPDARAGGIEQLTASLRERLRPADAGLFFRPVRSQALAAADRSFDFGWLFLGFSFFLIVSALLLMALLFVFGIEQRAEEVGTLLAIGYRPGRVRLLLAGEGMCLVLIGTALGLPAGTAYTRAVLGGLATVWRQAGAASGMHYHAEYATLAAAAAAAAATAAVAMWLALWRQVRRPARELLAGEAAIDCAPPVGAVPKRPVGLWIGLAALAGAIVTVAAVGGRSDRTAAGAFFAAGALLLTAVLMLCHALLCRLARTKGAAGMTLTGLSIRNVARRRWRSLTTIGLLAAGSFVVVAVAANRRDPREGAGQRSAGAGGFALFAESALPIVHDLNTPAGLKAYGLDPADLPGVRFVQIRVREGDDASCLNLNRPQTPRLLGVRWEQLASRGAFTFGRTVAPPPGPSAWGLLKRPAGEDVVPGIADAATITWALGRKVGDVLAFRDERGATFRVRLVASVAGSMLQGGIFIDEEEFAARYPTASGYRMFLIDAPAARAGGIAKVLSSGLQDVGFQVTPTARRLAEFGAVENAHLSIFQALGGLGLLLGSAAMGVVVLRNVLERRGELALMRSIGFSAGAVRRVVILEHAWLLAAGLTGGVASAAVAVVPALRSPGAGVPYAGLAWTLAAVVASGAAWTVLAAVLALRGRLVAALRNE